MTTYIAYTRVSTSKQGATGTSLDEQRIAIEAFGRQHSLLIARWFEETETAARSGRPQFDRLVRELERGGARGLILHKIDRGARNLRDWAAIGELIDKGVDVRFAHDDLRMDTRGGRLAADIQAVIAADYVRNLREETRKGIQGRLRQGLYPWRAPVGYIDGGRGRPKRIHPAYARLVAETFRLYASGGYSLRTLRDEMAARGLTNRERRRLTLNDVHSVLRNPFYAGIIRTKSCAMEYAGVHQAIISRDLFEAVQTRLRSRRSSGRIRRTFRYSRQIQHVCGRRLVGEVQKGRVYYRCHQCPRTSLREDRLMRLLQDERFESTSGST